MGMGAGRTVQTAPSVMAGLVPGTSPAIHAAPFSADPKPFRRLDDVDDRDEPRDEPGHDGVAYPGGPYEVAANFAFSAATTLGGANGATSPPIAAIWRTRVAVIGRTGEEAGKNTVCISGAIAPFMPAMFIS
jgi:hypothetical protein